MIQQFFWDFESIAVIQTAFLGDVALSLPLIQEIKNIKPEIKIFFLTTPLGAELSTCIKSIDEVIIFDKRKSQKGWKGIKEISGILNQQKIDCILSLHKSLRSSLITYLAGTPYSVGFKDAALSFLLSKRVHFRPDLHEMMRNLQFLDDFIDGKNTKITDLSGVELIFTNDDTDFVDNIFADNNIIGNNTITVSPGSVWQTKRWKEDSFAQLIDLLAGNGFKIIITGSSEDVNLCNYIYEKCLDKSSIVNLAGLTTIPQTILILKKVKALITNDSAPTHLAGLAGCPTVTIFGPTSPDFGFAPIGYHDAIIENTNLKCRPCAIHGSRQCPVKTHECMTSISPRIVYDKLMEIII